MSSSRWRNLESNRKLRKAQLDAYYDATMLFSAPLMLFMLVSSLSSTLVLLIIMHWICSTVFLNKAIFWLGREYMPEECAAPLDWRTIAMQNRIDKHMLNILIPWWPVKLERNQLA